MAQISAVDPERYPALHRATERGKELVTKEREGWGRVAEFRRTRHDAAADRLVKQLLGVKGDPMPEEVKAALRAKRAAMTDDEKRAEREERRTNRVLQRLAARATGKANGMETKNTEDAMEKSKKAAKAKAEPKAKAKAEPKVKTVKATKPAAMPKERDPRLPAPGSTIERKYKDRDLVVKVLEQGFEFEGTQYSSLTAVALKITGFKAISGPAFFRLTEPKPVEAK